LRERRDKQMNASTGNHTVSNQCLLNSSLRVVIAVL
jgi:hypothetical protein